MPENARQALQAIAERLRWLANEPDATEGMASTVTWRQKLNDADYLSIVARALLSSPRVEGETITPQAAIDEVENAFLAVASKDLPLLRDIRKRLRALGIRSLSPQGE